MKQAKNIGTTVAVTLALVAPLLAGGVVALRASSESPLEAAADLEPLIGVIESSQRTQDAQVTVSITLAEALSPATAAMGTVTALNIAPSTQVDTGLVLAQVNGQDLVAYTSAAPLYRDISKGLTGADVAIAQQLLSTLGFWSGTPDGIAGSGTEKAIMAFNKAHGYGDKNPILSLASLVWVGTGPVTVAKPSVALGATVSPGSALFSTTAGLAAANISETPGVAQEGELELAVGNVTAPYVPGSGKITDPAAVAAIAGAMGTATEVVGTVRLVNPIAVASIPASAIVADPQGRTCIFASETSAPTIVTPLGGSLGTIDLDPSLAGQEVLINPREVREDLTCGS